MRQLSPLTNISVTLMRIEHQRGAEVGLLEHQHRGDAEHHGRDDHLAQPPSAARRFLAQVAHHHEHDRELRQLRGFKVEESQIDPAPRAAGRMPDDRNRDQQPQRRRVDRIRIGQHRAIIEEQRADHDERADQNPQQLPRHQAIERVMTARIRRARDADHADAGEREDAQEQRPVEVAEQPAIDRRHQLSRSASWDRAPRWSGRESSRRSAGTTRSSVS